MEHLLSQPKNSLHCMELVGAVLFFSKYPANGPYPESDKFSPQAQLTFFYVPFNIIIPSTLMSSNFSLVYKYLGENFYVFLILPMRASCASYFIFLDIFCVRNTCDTSDTVKYGMTGIKKKEMKFSLF
jgi:hypothetical protein